MVMLLGIIQPIQVVQHPQEVLLSPTKDNALTKEVDTNFIMAFSEESEDEIWNPLNCYIISSSPYQENDILRDDSGPQLNVYQKPLSLDTFLVRTLTKPGDFVTPALVQLHLTS